MEEDDEPDETLSAIHLDVTHLNSLINHTDRDHGNDSENSSLYGNSSLISLPPTPHSELSIEPSTLRFGHTLDFIEPVLRSLPVRGAGVTRRQPTP